MAKIRYSAEKGTGPTNPFCDSRKTEDISQMFLQPRAASVSGRFT